MNCDQLSYKQVYIYASSNTSGVIGSRTSLDETNLLADLELKIGCPVRFLEDIDVTSGWINGTIGTVHAMHEEYVVMKRNSDQSTTTIRPIVRYVYKTCHGRQQTPLIPSSAATIHKVQSLTLGKLGIFLDTSFFSHGQFYVACSRIRSLEGLFFFREFPKHTGFQSNIYTPCLDDIAKIEQNIIESSGYICFSLCSIKLQAQIKPLIKNIFFMHSFAKPILHLKPLFSFETLLFQQ